MTLPKEELLKIFQTAKDVEQDETCARIVGINMEGPFLDPVKKGAHVEGYIRKPDIEFFRACNEAAGGMIKLVTLAPNMEGSENLSENYIMKWLFLSDIQQQIMAAQQKR